MFSFDVRILAQQSLLGLTSGIRDDTQGCWTGVFLASLKILL